MAVYIIGYDVWAAVSRNETLSEAFYNAVRHPVRKWPVGVVWTYLTVHLFHVLPERFDPLRVWP